MDSVKLFHKPSGKPVVFSASAWAAMQGRPVAKNYELITEPKQVATPPEVLHMEQKKEPLEPVAPLETKTKGKRNLAGK